MPNSDVEAVNVEHILPQNPGAGWNNIDPDAAVVLYQRLGNLALLQAGKNSDIGNDAYTQKRLVLASFILTKTAVDAEMSGKAEIAARQKWLAELALKTWPLKV